MTDRRRSPLPETPLPTAPQRRRGRPRKDSRQPGEPEMREAILRSAALHFATRGYDNASLANIAAGANATTGAIYAHFRGKPELLVEVIRETLAFLSYESRDSVADGPASLEGYVRWLLHVDRRTTRQLISEVYTTADRVPKVFEMVKNYAEGETKAVAAMITRWAEEGLCDPPADPLLVAHQFFVEILGLCRIDSFGPELLDDKGWRELVLTRVRQLLGVNPHVHQ
ncbi:TetR/AcrR family transcriptional regulator [Ilumatobacter coccineus]|uniref:Putative TetR family transcriptional regulator n=1 Tax=Ilumatobacter coccineus (strain NBRC 103263 / KCTC 29153 / YM16-304) TaxID=1313172 RepID=A0A6C7E6X7_ILUCY|nr:TetR/AcrR family transcriptional regulator [Ilumatobacter coccineus]BAN00925.1 putative TetR family transcriptional regulator [Ilumatobacter coccineus YM16-304]